MANCNAFVTMMWGPATHGKDSPYNANHVNNIYHMLKKTQKGTFKLFCLGDSSDHLHEDIEFIEIPESVKTMIVTHGGHFSKLYLFSKEFRQIMDDKFLYLDLDSVIFNDLSYLFEADAGLLILEGSGLDKVLRFADPEQHEVGRSFSGFIDTLFRKGPMASVFYLRYSGRRWCRFNSSIVMISKDDHDMWEEFDPEHAKKAIAAADLIGTDQAWLQLSYPRKYTLLTRSDGFWRHKSLRSYTSKAGKLPSGIKFVAFPGAQEKPWTLKNEIELKDIVSHYTNSDTDKKNG